MKIALFGGTFDPIHKGHIEIAKQAYEELKIDKLYFIPANKNPFKKRKISTTNEQRIQMLNIAIKKIKDMNFEVSEFETKRGGNSYTFETIRYFRQKFPNDELFFIMGSDLLPTLNKWENIDEISSKCKIVIYRRNNKINKINIKKYNCLLMKNKILKDSSTNIRNGIFDFLDEDVNKYIGNNFLYSKEIVHGILSAKRAKHCVAAATFAAELAKTINYDAKIAYYAGLFHDICKELNELEFREFISQFNLNGFDKEIFPNYKLHQIAGSLWLKYIYKIDNEEIIKAVSIHTSLALDLSTLDKILFIADKICEGRAFDGVQKLRQLVKTNFEQGFKEVVKRTYEFNKNKGIIFDKEQEKIYKKWMS
ncbi:nicotinate-nucleotide adenylyltransferase [Mycoplasmopsis lipofaciens]|uniref:nicotinate-nucleotide adenylyltransferase n=1 Tax=Mycoplasmopsis lipofaciens TaxID=114884 RepID=UPI000486F9CA|nr:nicotinate-nucleotide adenylyltransferase [Mycoplasmopsis lipofaciens]